MFNCSAVCVTAAQTIVCKNAGLFGGGYGLCRMGKLLMAAIDGQKAGKIKKVPLKNVILEIIIEKPLVKPVTTKSDEHISGFLAAKIRVGLGHLRILKGDRIKMRACLNKLAKPDQEILQAMVDRIMRDTPEGERQIKLEDTLQDSGGLVAKRESAPNAAVDDPGFPAMGSTPDDSGFPPMASTPTMGMNKYGFPKMFGDSDDSDALDDDDNEVSCASDVIEIDSDSEPDVKKPSRSVKEPSSFVVGGLKLPNIDHDLAAHKGGQKEQTLERRADSAAGAKGDKKHTEASVGHTLKFGQVYLEIYERESYIRYKDATGKRKLLVCCMRPRHNEIVQQVFAVAGPPLEP